MPSGLDVLCARLGYGLCVTRFVHALKGFLGFFPAYSVFVFIGFLSRVFCCVLGTGHILFTYIYLTDLCACCNPVFLCLFVSR